MKKDDIIKTLQFAIDARKYFDQYVFQVETAQASMQKELDLLKQENQRLELLRTEQYHEVEKLKQENERLKKFIGKRNLYDETVTQERDRLVIEVNNLKAYSSGKIRELHSAKAEIESLKGNIRQSGEIWSPVYDYIASHSEITVGDSIAGKTLQFIKERDELKGKLKQLDSEVGLYRDLI